MPSPGGAWKELLRAASENNSSLVAFHLSHKIDPNFQHPEYFTSPLFEAIRAGHVSICQQLVDTGGSSLTTPEELTGSTPLEVALEEKQHAIVDFLLERLLPKDKAGSIMTIMVSGNLDKPLLRQLAATGHIIWINAAGAADAGLLVQDLQLTTKNIKVRLLSMVPQKVPQELEEVTHWIVRGEENDEMMHQLLPYMIKYAPTMCRLQRTIVIASQAKPMSAELVWLLSRTSIATAVVEPKSWWDTLGDYGWSQTWEQTLWWLLTTFDPVEGRLHNYKRKVVVDCCNNSNVSTPLSQPTQDEWDIKFKPLASPEK
eukprot:CAMPEP_0119014104 /NCGR_PEP_ID=MMETSP1176-20130426/9354_1 /TAXON_ID=265551 /ORGANISM="Synedropsis recta cf, Strain CCMP1620" /LENGTH=314 /DNA_ID=CAMNT_0006967243 /DNA_START=136 /DNA_END=1080 /DNA_ORIENTATION=+